MRPEKFKLQCFVHFFCFIAEMITENFNNNTPVVTILVYAPLAFLFPDNDLYPLAFQFCQIDGKPFRALRVLSGRYQYGL